MNQRKTYDTSDVPLLDRLSYWSKALRENYAPVKFYPEGKASFDGKIEIVHHSLLSISKIESQAQKIILHQGDIARKDNAHFFLCLQLARTSQISQFSVTSILNPDDMALYTTLAPFTLEFPDNFGQIVIRMPTDRLLTRLPNAESLAAKSIDGLSEVGRLVGQSIKAFAVHAGSSDPTFQSMVQNTLIDLVATGLASRIGSSAHLSSPEQRVLLRAKSFIRDNLGNLGLNRNVVAKEVGISIRRLNAIFSKEGDSVSNHIRTLRIDKAKNDLTDPRFRRMSISEIALKNGFSNFQHFSRLFKEQVGRSPKEFRGLSVQAQFSV